MKAPRTEPGSFRDREGRVYYIEDRVFRALSERALGDWRALEATRFFPANVIAGKVVGTREATVDLLPQSEGQALEWVGALEHERIPFVSYPYEWSFNMLKDAALLHLDLMLDAIGESFVLKDSSAYNVQWRGDKPVFIDVPSFERWEEGDPWVGYLQFCQMFLYPLLLRAYKDLPFRPWLRGSIDGINPDEANQIFSRRDRLRRGVFTHVYLQSRLQALTAANQSSTRQEIRRSGFKLPLIENNVRGLRALIGRLTWRRSRSEWSEYGAEHSYTDLDRRAKSEFVERVAAKKHWRLVWDLGCNEGTFSRIAAEHADYAVAMDADELAIDRLYLALKKERRGNVLPLVNNLVDPSPALGWRGQERRSMPDRGRPDLTLALALIHHLVVGANVPLAELVEWLACLDSHLVIEFVDREDAMVKKLLLNKRDHYADYEPGLFEDCLSQHFRIEDKLELDSGTRTLYSASPRS